MKSLLVFIPKEFANLGPGYMYGKVTYDRDKQVKKFFVIGTRKPEPRTINKSHTDLIGYYSVTKNDDCEKKKFGDWLHICRISGSNSIDYLISDIIVDHRKIIFGTLHTVVIVYDQLALLQAELFTNNVPSVNHFQELKQILEKKMINDRANEKSLLVRFKETFLIWNMMIYLYPVMFLCKVTNELLPVLKYSTLGLHLNGWLENTKWMLVTVIQEKKFTLKTGNHLLATVLDVSFGILLLRILLQNIGDIPPSQILLDNAEVSVIIFFFLMNRDFHIREFKIES